MLNLYYSTLKREREEILSKVLEIFSNHKNYLTLKIEDINLLEDEDSAIPSSTSIGFAVEEFLSKSLKNLNPNFIREKNTKTTLRSFDLLYIGHYDNNKKINILINIKVEKSSTSKNNAIAAIGKLYDDYLNFDFKNEKAYLILKILYEIEEGKIKILKPDSFFLEEVSFENGHKQDKRNWSQIMNLNSGRLQINSKNFIKKDVESISYESTKLDLKKIFNENIEKSKRY